MLALFGLVLRRAFWQHEERGTSECREPEAMLPHLLSR